MTTAPATAPTVEISLPLRTLYPQPGQFAGLLIAGVAAATVSVLRPKGLPAAVQRAADVTIAIYLAAHPVETLYARRQLSRYPVSRRLRRTVTATALIVGIPGWQGAVKAVARAASA